MPAIYSRFMGVALMLSGCVATAPGAGPAQGEATALASSPPLQAAGSPAPAPAVALPSSVGPSCRSDADCQLVPDYCAECACVSLTMQQKMPECAGEELKCILNPCADHVAICVDGRCSAEAGSFR